MFLCITHGRKCPPFPMGYRQPQRRGRFRSAGTRTPSIPSLTSRPRGAGCAAQPQLRLCRDGPRKAEFTAGDGAGPEPCSLLRAPALSVSRKTRASCSLRVARSPRPSPLLLPVLLAGFSLHLAPAGTEGPRALSQAGVLAGNHMPRFTPASGCHICLRERDETCVS